MLHYQILISTTQRKTTKLYKNSKFKFWDEEFELPNGLYYVSIYKIILSISFQKHEETIDNFQIEMYNNKIEKKLDFLKI